MQTVPSYGKSHNIFFPIMLTPRATRDRRRAGMKGWGGTPRTAQSKVVSIVSPRSVLPGPNSALSNPYSVCRLVRPARTIRFLVCHGRSSHESRIVYYGVISGFWAGNYLIESTACYDYTRLYHANHVSPNDNAFCTQYCKYFYFLCVIWLSYIFILYNRY